MNARRLATPACLTVLAAALVAGCTVFDGLTAAPPTTTDPDAGGNTDATYLPIEDAVRACGRVFGCGELARSIAGSIGVPADEQSFSRCVSWFAGPIPKSRTGFDAQAAMLACVAAAPSCEAARACSFVEQLAPGDPRCAAGDDVCAGEEAQRCGELYLERCASPRFSPGSECRLGFGGRARCALAACLPVSDGPPQCSGDTLIACDPQSRLRVATDCTAFGLACAQGAQGASALCSANGGILLCETVGATQCSPDGTRARVCVGAVESEIDCAALGGSCKAEGAGVRCARESDTCSPADPDVDACDGSMLSLCVAGKPIAFDCASVGLSCQPGDAARTGHCG